jgi:hypothetical protein
MRGALTGFAPLFRSVFGLAHHCAGPFHKKPLPASFCRLDSRTKLSFCVFQKLFSLSAMTIHIIVIFSASLCHLVNGFHNLRVNGIKIVPITYRLGQSNCDTDRKKGSDRQQSFFHIVFLNSINGSALRIGLSVPSIAQILLPAYPACRFRGRDTRVSR